MAMNDTTILTNTVRSSSGNKKHSNFFTSYRVLLLFGFLTISESGYLTIANFRTSFVVSATQNGGDMKAYQVRRSRNEQVQKQPSEPVVPIQTHDVESSLRHQHHIRRAVERQYPDLEALTIVQTKAGEVTDDNTKTTSTNSSSSSSLCPVNTTRSIYHCLDPFATLETEVECHNVTCQWRVNRYSNDSQPEFCQYIYLPTYFNKTTTKDGDGDVTEKFVLTTILPDALEPCLLWEMEHGTTGITTESIDLSILYRTAAPITLAGTFCVL